MDKVFRKAMETDVTQTNQLLVVERLVSYWREKLNNDLQQKLAILRDKAARLETTKLNSITNAHSKNLKSAIAN